MPEVGQAGNCEEHSASRRGGRGALESFPLSKNSLSRNPGLVVGLFLLREREKQTMIQTNVT